jgi:hypothetical protein
MLTGDAITHWLHTLEGLLPLVVVVFVAGDVDTVRVSRVF